MCPTRSSATSEHQAKKAEPPEAADSPNVDVIVNESTRVISPQGTTTFQIRWQTSAPKKRPISSLTAHLSPNLEFRRLVSVPQGIGVNTSEKRDTVKFDPIDKLAPGK